MIDHVFLIGGPHQESRRTTGFCALICCWDSQASLPLFLPAYLCQIETSTFPQLPHRCSQKARQAKSLCSPNTHSTSSPLLHQERALAPGNPGSQSWSFTTNILCLHILFFSLPCLFQRYLSRSPVGARVLIKALSSPYLTQPFHNSSWPYLLSNLRSGCSQKVLRTVSLPVKLKGKATNQ